MAKVEEKKKVVVDEALEIVLLRDQLIEKAQRLVSPDHKTLLNIIVYTLTDTCQSIVNQIKK